MDSVGPFGRTVADAVHGLNVIVGMDERDPMTCSPLRPPPQDYTKHLTTKASLKGAIFGLPGKRCWDLVPAERAQVACGVFDAIKAAGGEVIRTEFPCAEDRIPPDGHWDWYVLHRGIRMRGLICAGNIRNIASPQNQSSQ